MRNSLTVRPVLNKVKIFSLFDSRTLGFKYSSMNSLQIILWIHRLIGITFGGLVIDSNGRLAVNNGLKYIGYVLILLLTSFDVVLYIWILIQGDMGSKIESQVLAQIPKSIGRIYWVGLVLSKINFVAIKILTHYYYNTNGQEMVKLIYNNWIKNECVKIYTLITLCVSVIFVFTAFIIYGSVTKFNSTLLLLSVFEYSLGFLYFWSFTAMIWIISVQY